jgi:hypothetical protein
LAGLFINADQNLANRLSDGRVPANFIVLPTKIELIRRIACLADNQKSTLLFVQIHIVGVAGSWGSGSKFIVASISIRTERVNASLSDVRTRSRFQQRAAENSSANGQKK